MLLSQGTKACLAGQLQPFLGIALQLRAMRYPQPHYSAFLPICCSGIAVFRLLGAKIRALGGHARAISALQTTVAATEAPRKINVTTQAEINQACDGGGGVLEGRRRSVATTTGEGEPDAGAPDEGEPGKDEPGEGEP